MATPHGASNGAANGTAANGTAANGLNHAVEHTNGTAGRKNVAENNLPAMKGGNNRVKRPEVDSTFKQYAQLIHAARRPLPKQSGDGSYLNQGKAKTSLFQDLKSMGPRGWGTLLAVRKNKKSGELTDDKTYIMERVIQVCLLQGVLRLLRLSY